MTEKIQLHVDWTRCDGRGLCTELLPHQLTRDDWGYPLARTRERHPQIAPEYTADARQAVQLCPRIALSLRTSTTE